MKTSFEEAVRHPHVWDIVTGTANAARSKEFFMRIYKILISHIYLNRLRVYTASSVNSAGTTSNANGEVKHHTHLLNLPDAFFLVRCQRFGCVTVLMPSLALMDAYHSAYPFALDPY